MVTFIAVAIAGGSTALLLGAPARNLSGPLLSKKEALNPALQEERFELPPSPSVRISGSFSFASERFENNIHTELRTASYQLNLNHTVPPGSGIGYGSFSELLSYRSATPDGESDLLGGVVPLSWRNHRKSSHATRWGGSLAPTIEPEQTLQLSIETPIQIPDAIFTIPNLASAPNLVKVHLFGDSTEFLPDASALRLCSYSLPQGLHLWNEALVEQSSCSMMTETNNLAHAIPSSGSINATLEHGVAHLGGILQGVIGDNTWGRGCQVRQGANGDGDLIPFQTISARSNGGRCEISIEYNCKVALDYFSHDGTQVLVSAVGRVMTTISGLPQTDQTAICQSWIANNGSYTYDDQRVP